MSQWQGSNGAGSRKSKVKNSELKSPFSTKKRNSYRRGLKKDGYSNKHMKAAIESFRSEPSSPCWDALLAGSDAWTGH